MLNPVMVKVVGIFIFGVVMLFPFNFKLIRILNVVIAVLVRVVVVKCVCTAVFMMTMQSVSEVVVFVPQLFFFSVAFTSPPVMCTLLLGIPFVRTVIEMISRFYFSNFVVGFDWVAIGMSFLVLDVIVIRQLNLILVLFLLLSMSPSLEFIV